MSADTALPIELLREIRDAVNRASDRPGERIDNVEKKLGDRIDATNQRLETLEKRTIQGFTETNTKLADLTGRVDRMGDPRASRRHPDRAAGPGRRGLKRPTSTWDSSSSVKAG